MRLANAASEDEPVPQRLAAERDGPAPGVAGYSGSGEVVRRMSCIS